MALSWSCLDFDRSGFGGSGSSGSTSALAPTTTNPSTSGTVTPQTSNATDDSSGSSSTSSDSTSSGASSSSSTTGPAQFVPFQTAEPLFVLDGNQNSPSVTDDHTVLFFEQIDGAQWRLMRSERATPDDGWGTPTDASSLFPDDQYGDPAVTGDGRAVVLTLQPGGSSRPALAPVVGGAVQTPETFAPRVLANERIFAASIRGNDLELVFTSGNINRAFYRASRPDPLAEFAAATRVTEFEAGGDAIRLWLSPETGPDELAVFSVRVNGNAELYYWRAGDASPIPMPLNSEGNDFDPWLSADRSTLYFVREDDNGENLWVARHP